jgi:hypothetical protein
MRNFLLSLMLLASAGVHSQTAKQVTITVRASSEAAGDKILLGEVATIDADAATKQRLSQVSLGETPIFGLKRILTKSGVTTRLLAAKERPEQMLLIVPEGATVVRKGQTVDSATLVETAKAYVQRQIGAEVELTEKEAVREITVGLGELQIDAVAITQTPPAVTVTLSIKVDGKPSGTRTVRLLADLSQGVKANDVVKIRMRSNLAVVELTGKAKESGVIGQTIQVVTSRNTTHTAKVVAPGIVEVSL